MTSNFSQTQEDRALLQLFDEFNGIEEEIILAVWQESQNNIDNARAILGALTGSVESQTTLEHENENKSSIYGTEEKKDDNASNWNKLNQIQSSIVRELLARLLVNILREPTELKYQRIKDSNLKKVIEKKCTIYEVDPERAISFITSIFTEMNFKKIDDSWQYDNEKLDFIKLWKYFRMVLDNDKKVPEQMWMCTNEVWKEYYIATDSFQKSIGLLDLQQNDKKMIYLQVNKADEKEQEKMTNVLMESWNDLSELETSGIKWLGITINNSFRFRTLSIDHAVQFREQIALFNFFVVRWKTSMSDSYDYLPLNPYKTTLREGLNQIKRDFKAKEGFTNGQDEIIEFELMFEHCEPSIFKIADDGSNDILLHEFYKEFYNYPNIIVTWIIRSFTMVPYERTINIKYPGDNETDDKSDEKNEKKEIKNEEKSKNIESQDQSKILVSSSSDQFNPFLYLVDINHVIKNNFTNLISANERKEVLANDQNTNKLKILLHTVIRNGYLHELINIEKDKDAQSINQQLDIIKQKIGFKEENWTELKLDEEILIILKEIKLLFHSPIHKRMGYPLQSSDICALLLRYRDSCNSQFNKDQIQLRYPKWKWLDFCLQKAITILSHHERREEWDEYLYCGLRDVKLQKSEQIRKGYFLNFTSTSKDIKIAQSFRGVKGCILKFHPSMRRILDIISCDMSWISPYKHEQETLFARSHLSEFGKGNILLNTWDAMVESENEYGQVLLLSWSEYNKYYSQTLQVSSIFNNGIDQNIIWSLLHWFQNDTTQAMEILLEFEEWKNNPSVISQYMNEMEINFKNRRCCNQQINLFSIFLEQSDKIPSKGIDWATMVTIYGLPCI